MSAARSSHLHRLTTIGLAGLFVILGVFVAASPASAHDSLLPDMTDPAPGATVETMPDEITLAFSDALLTMGPQDTVVDVLAPSGADVSEGDAVVDGALVTQGIGAATEAGEYTVEWHVVSSDGHPTEGKYTFTVTTASAQTPDPGTTAAANGAPATADEPAVTDTTTVAPDQGQDDSSANVWPWILLVVAVIVVVAVLLPLTIRRSREGGANGPSGQS